MFKCIEFCLVLVFKIYDWKWALANQAWDYIFEFVKLKFGNITGSVKVKYTFLWEL